MTEPLLAVEFAITIMVSVMASYVTRTYLADHDLPPTRATGTTVQVLLTAGAAGATLALAATTGHTLHAATLLPAIAPAVAAATVDAHAHRLPNTLTTAVAALAAAGTIAAAIALHSPALVVGALAGTLAVGVIGLVMVIAGTSLGMGDVKLTVSLALSLGAWSWTLPTVAAAGALILSLPSALIGLRHGDRHRHLALGPYLVAAALIVAVFAG